MASSPWSGAPTPPDFVPVRTTALGPQLNVPRSSVGRVERNPLKVTDRTHQSAFLLADHGAALTPSTPHPSNSN